MSSRLSRRTPKTPDFPCKSSRVTRPIVGGRRRLTNDFYRTLCDASTAKRSQTTMAVFSVQMVPGNDRRDYAPTELSPSNPFTRIVSGLRSYGPSTGTWQTDETTSLLTTEPATAANAINIRAAFACIRIRNECRPLCFRPKPISDVKSRTWPVPRVVLGAWQKEKSTHSFDRLGNAPWNNTCRP